ncbi:HNH endonuclease family protein [Pseudarthrobacter sp. NPDC058196]|uniref:HNH endonuclease family protein n=1 Tax=Pseudarthrobacter sp. NPDC058196 TaxID=3346376 RepID=UPI0036DBFBA5
MKKTRSGVEFFGLLTGALLAVSVAGCGASCNAVEAIHSDPGVAVNVPHPAVAMDKALAELEGIPVKGRASAAGYSREEFGPAWADTDHNGCDTRNDILARDLTNRTFKPGSHNCVVTTGTLADKYTGTTTRFVRGQNTSSAVQIDHIVPLGDAWQNGAQQLTAELRRELANDPLNLMATDGPTNTAKGENDAATWLPPNQAFRCEYVARQIAVKAKYGLWVTQAEHDAIIGILNDCE